VLESYVSWPTGTVGAVAQERDEGVLAAGGAPCSSAGDARAFPWTDDSDLVLNQVNPRPGEVDYPGSATGVSSGDSSIGASRKAGSASMWSESTWS